MPRFIYKASTQEGVFQEGIMEGNNVDLIIERLRSLNYLPIEVREEEIARPGLLLRLSSRIRKGEVISFIQELSNLISTGTPLDRSLTVLEEITPNQRFKGIISEIKMEIEKGNSLSDALASHPRLFSRLYVNMIRVGEASGALEIILKRLAEFGEQEEELRDYIKSMMAYPLVMVFVGGLAITIILTFVIPRFVIIFEEMGQALPLPTLVLISISKLFVHYWWLIGGLFLGGFFGLRGYLKTEKGRDSYDRTRLKMPILGKLTEMFCVVRFSRSLGTLIKGGVPLLEALSIVREAVGNRVISAGISRTLESVKEGERIATPLRESEVFPPLLVHMVACGEETGSLEEMLNKVADNYETKLRNRIRRLIALLEPSMILFMGSIVAFVVAAILLPIFTMNELPF